VYDFACHEFCGAAHHTMAGKFTIVEEEAFERETFGEGSL